MTEAQLGSLQNDILRAAFDAQQSVEAIRLRLSLIGQSLGAIARAFEEHPEEITTLPEANSLYDYRKEIAVLRDAENSLRICAELRVQIERAKSAERRKQSLSRQSSV